MGKVVWFLMHACVAAWAEKCKQLEQLCHNIARPAVSEKRLSLTLNGKLRYHLKTAYRDRTSHVIFKRSFSRRFRFLL
jgi:hypothetical protein